MNKIINRKLYVICSALLLLTLKIYAQPLDWAGLGNYNSGFGTNGSVYALANYNGNLIAAGSFSSAAGVSVSNIAAWNGSSWAPLGAGLNDSVYALAVFNGDLYAGGYFTQAGGVSANHIARWNGSVWQSLGPGLDEEVDALTVWDSMLVMGGKFSSFGQNICAYDGSNWYQMGSGTDDDVYALTVYNGNLIAGGKFEHAGGIPASKIARWNGSVWSSFGGNTNENIYALGLYNNSILIAGGMFTTISGVSANHVAQWVGNNWSQIGGGVDDGVYAVTSYRGALIIGGQFRFAGNDTLYVDRVARWDGITWSRMITGMNNKVSALFVKDTNLYAGGEFTTAGGKFVSRVAYWGTQITRTISGEVRYADNNQLVPSGNVRAWRMDINSRELILEDSGRVVNGYYLLPNVRKDSLFIASFPDDVLVDYVPTYHPSTIDWAAAVVVYPETNLSNINVSVYRNYPSPQNHHAASVGGHVYLNYMPPFLDPNPPLPFKSGAIVYIKAGGQFKQFTVSSQLEQYALPNVQPGDYEVYVNRIGYTSGFRNVVVGVLNIDTLNFYLDTTSLIGIQNISSEVPKNFELKQNYPNPFNPVTKIQFALVKSGFVKLSVYNMLGQEVVVLVNEDLKAGKYEVTFNALRLTSGVYFYRISADGYSQTRKMVLLK
jgi:hypothetical protein